MINIEGYLKAPFDHGGRTLDGLDCWGLLLLVRAELGCPPLPPLRGVTRETPVAMCHQYSEISAGLERCEAEVGAVAAVFRGRVFVHCGVVIEIDGRLAVIETNPGSGPRWLYVPRFLEQYARVIFYRDRNLSESA